MGADEKAVALQREKMEQLADSGAMDDFVPSDEELKAVGRYEDPDPDGRYGEPGSNAPENELGIDLSVLQSLGLSPDAAREDGGDEPHSREQELARTNSRQTEIIASLMDRLGSMDSSERLTTKTKEPTVRFDVSSIPKPEGMDDEEWEANKVALGPMVSALASKMSEHYDTQLERVQGTVGTLVNRVGSKHMESLLPGYNDPETKAQMNKMWQSLGAPEELNDERMGAILYAATQFFTGKAAKAGAREASHRDLNAHRVVTEASGGASRAPQKPKLNFQDMPEADFERLLDALEEG